MLFVLHTSEKTVDFMRRCISFYDYVPYQIQFTWNRSKIKKKHLLDALYDIYSIRHTMIGLGTPQHNDKMERSHHNDNEHFYHHLSFYSLEDLRQQGAQYVKRSNSIPMIALRYLTPKEIPHKPFKYHKIRFLSWDNSPKNRRLRHNKFRLWNKKYIM